MALKDRLDADMKTAMKAKETLRLGVIRMVRSAIKYREIEIGKPLEDADVLAVLASEVKRRRDAVEQYRAGGRADLAEKEEAEIAVLRAYQPEQLGPEELAAKVDEVIGRLGAKGPKDMGAVMKALLPEVQGRAESRAVSELVKQRLAPK